MKTKNKFLNKLLVLAILILSSLTILMGSESRQSTFLFCLKPDIQPLSISKSNDRLLVDNSSIQNFIDSHDIENIEPWLPGARATDHDGDIYLNRIYRAFIGDADDVARSMNLLKIYYPKMIILKQ